MHYFCLLWFWLITTEYLSQDSVADHVKRSETIFFWLQRGFLLIIMLHQLYPFLTWLTLAPHASHTTLKLERLDEPVSVSQTHTRASEASNITRYPLMFNPMYCINFKWAMPDASALPLHVVIIRRAAKCTTASLWFSLYPMILLIQFLEAIFIHFLP